MAPVLNWIGAVMVRRFFTTILAILCLGSVASASDTLASRHLVVAEARELARSYLRMAHVRLAQNADPGLLNLESKHLLERESATNGIKLLKIRLSNVEIMVPKPEETYPGCRDKTYAYVDYLDINRNGVTDTQLKDNKIYVCPYVFEARFNPQQLSQILLHELVHQVEERSECRATEIADFVFILGSWNYPTVRYYEPACGKLERKLQLLYKSTSSYL